MALLLLYNLADNFQYSYFSDTIGSLRGPIFIINFRKNN